MEAELEALRRDREEKIKAIAEKKRQVEELKAKRQKRAEEQAKRAAGDRKASGDLGRQVENLVAEILGTEGKGNEAKAERPLNELAESNAAAATTGGGHKAVALQTELGQASVTILPQEADVYNKSVQTDAVQIGEGGAAKGGGGGGGAKVGPQSTLHAALDRAKMRAVRPDTAATGGAARGGALKRTVQADASAVPDDIAQAAKDVVELSQEEKDRIMGLPDFKQFFDRTSVMVERILGQEAWDSFADFKDTNQGRVEEEQDLIFHSADFMEERWTQGRPVTDCRFSPRAHEYFLAAYGQKENPTLSDPDGCMLVWNVAMKHRPEMIFSSQSAVLAAQFHKFNPALYFGGTYSGGIVLWDARAKSGPVQRTPLSGKGHSHPVQALQQVGTQNATNLITASNDGRLCVWSLAMLVLPQETIDLKNETKNRRDLAVMSLAFPENETNVLYVGAEDGSVCQCNLHGSKVGVTELYDGHDGPVTGLDLHPRAEAAQHGLEQAGDLALSTSFDWSVKIWSVKQSQWPVLSLDNYEDYVYDAKWHPSHPAVFVTADGEGHVDLWNLNANTEAPTERCEHPSRKLAVNRCSWSVDGKKLVAGDSEGMLSIYSVDRNISQPRNEEYATFQDRMKSFHPIQPRSRDSVLSSAGRR